MRQKPLGQQLSRATMLLIASSERLVVVLFSIATEERILFNWRNDAFDSMAFFREIQAFNASSSTMENLN